MIGAFRLVLRKGLAVLIRQQTWSKLIYMVSLTSACSICPCLNGGCKKTLVFFLNHHAPQAAEIAELQARAVGLQEKATRMEQEAKDKSKEASDVGKQGVETKNDLEQVYVHRVRACPKHPCQHLSYPCPCRSGPSSSWRRRGSRNWLLRGPRTWRPLNSSKKRYAKWATRRPNPWFSRRRTFASRLPRLKIMPNRHRRHVSRSVRLVSQ